MHFGRALSSLCLFFFILTLASCVSSSGHPEIHIHDRHGLSAPPIQSYARAHKGTTLVLFDYHHDAGPFNAGDPEILSTNWVGRLIADGSLKKVLWVSGRDLLLPAQNARRAWLQRKLSSLPYDTASLIQQRLILTDWHELENETLKGPLAVTVDFDIFCHDPGDSPRRFAAEIARWIAQQNPGILTLALSAAYQNNAAQAWELYGDFISLYARSSAGMKSEYFLEAGPYSARPEGEEERKAWLLWESERSRFGRRGSVFLPGAAVWIGAPLPLRHQLCMMPVHAGDRSAVDIISGWQDRDEAGLEADFPPGRSDALLGRAAAAIEDLWQGRALAAGSTAPEGSVRRTAPAPGGIALRIQNRGRDRGCLSYCRQSTSPESDVAECARAAARDPRYSPLSPSEKDKLDLELSVYGAWKPMENPLDFRPGLDSLLLVDGADMTVLQASVAAERGYSREEFLRRLSLKAKLGPDGWKRGGLRFRRAATIWSRRPLLSIEASPEK